MIVDFVKFKRSQDIQLLYEIIYTLYKNTECKLKIHPYIKNIRSILNLFLGYF